MIAKISNLGPIKSVSVDLRKPFTLFCGPNNTGKTYLSYILYAIHKGFGFVDFGINKSLAKQLFEKREIVLTQDDVELYISKFNAHIKSNLGVIFGIGDDVAKRLFGAFSLEISLSEGEFSELTKRPSKLSAVSEHYKVTVTKEAKSDIITCHTEGDTKGFDEKIMSNLNFILDNIMNDIFLGSLGGARMLTVERNSIYTFKTELSITRNNLIELIQLHEGSKDSDIVGLVNRNSRRYPVAIMESLHIANDLVNIQKHKSSFCDVAQQIERGVLHGEVIITDNGEVEFAPANMSDSKQLPIHLSSSIVKTMSSLVIYLKHLAHKGDVLIIDEPELNFHPDVQIYLMKIFAILVNKGLRLIVSTHSDYIMREVNNLIMAKKTYSQHSKVVSTLGYTQTMLLNKKNVDVKYFQYEGGEQKVMVNDVTIYDDGFSVESIDNTISQQNNTTETLYNIII